MLNTILRGIGLLLGLTLAQQVFALTIIGNYIPPGHSFPNGEVADSFAGFRNIQDVQTYQQNPLHPLPPQADLDAAVQTVFKAAARYWEQRFDDPWTITVNHGFLDFANHGFPTTASGIMIGVTTDPQTGRLTVVNIYSNAGAVPNFGHVPLWYLDPSPMADEEYGPFTNYFADLGAGPINTGRTTAAIPYHEPPSNPDPSFFCGNPPGPCGAYQDLLGNLLHEMAHALNENTVNLRRFNSPPSTTASSGNMVIPSGPFAGSLMPWVSTGGGHVHIPPPNGNLMVDYDGYGGHRKLVTDADALVIATVSNFKRVNLDGVSYVALDNFNDTSIFTLNGDVQSVTQGGNNVLRLTPDSAGKRGSAFLTKPILLGPDSSFQTQFVFRISGNNGSGVNGSDGLAFVIQRDKNGAAALGNAGEGLGFGINDIAGNLFPPIKPSVAIEFDTHQNAYDFDDNHIALILDGDVRTHLATAKLSCPGAGGGFPCLNSGTDVHVWIDYDGINHRLQVFLTDQPVKPSDPTLIAEHLDIFSQVGARAFFGFTAGTGIGFNSHDVNSLTLTVSPNVAPIILGDLNDDGKVDCIDLTTIKASFGKRRGEPGFDLNADANSDGMVDVRDLVLVTQKLPPGTPCK